MAILIVDDEIDFRESLGEILKEEGFRVLTASNGNEALKYFKTESIRFMLVDYSMRGMNGEELILELDRLNKRPPSLIITALAPWQMMGLMKIGVGYIRKPVNTPLLIGTIKTLMEKGASYGSEKVC